MRCLLLCSLTKSSIFIIDIASISIFVLQYTVDINERTDYCLILKYDSSDVVTRQKYLQRQFLKNFVLESFECAPPWVIPK